MKTIVVREIDEVFIPADATFVLDLTEQKIKDCIGCWSCWQKTPGQCAFHDLDNFYSAFLQADKAVFYTGVSCDFISGNLKTLFDRMIPHYLPYTSYKTGESMHVPRYERYPDIDVYYQDDFSDDEAKKLYEEYLTRVFYQFHIQNIHIQPINGHAKQEVTI